ncbi:MAG: DUF402 domain-containing protein [Nocardioides sp.]
MTPRPGSAIRVEMSKWGGRPHWSFAAALLGSDEYGDWIGTPAGTLITRPGAEVVTPVDQVTLVPPPGADDARGWLATFHAEGGPVRVYVDMTTPPVWEGSILRAVDLDLDVIVGTDGRVRVEDSDEFAEHRVRFGYPAEVVGLARDTCAAIFDAARSGGPPYDRPGSADRWLARAAVSG